MKVSCPKLFKRRPKRSRSQQSEVLPPLNEDPAPQDLPPAPTPSSLEKETFEESIAQLSPYYDDSEKSVARMLQFIESSPKTYESHYTDALAEPQDMQWTGDTLTSELPTEDSAFRLYQRIATINPYRDYCYTDTSPSTNQANGIAITT
uniref:ARAD1D15136p n=1 Tax=Blastobotrys adeninivorans TaxID=409370 RepID=A0A060T909_BLAAD